MPFARYFCIFKTLVWEKVLHYLLGCLFRGLSHSANRLAEMQRCAFFCRRVPELAKVYPTNKLPDLRGEFIVAGMTEEE